MVATYREPRRDQLSVAQRLKQVGLLHYWPLNEASGDAKDYFYGNSGPLDLTDTNTVTAAAGPSNNIRAARQFTAANQEKLTRADAPSLEMGVRANGFSVSAWVYADAIGALMGVVAKDGGVAGTRSWKLDVLATNNFQFSLFDGTNVISTLNGVATISATTWYHVLVTNDSTRAQIYVNGALDLNQGNGTAAWGDSTAAFQIGQDLAAGAGRFWNGRITQLAIWRRRLLVDEILWLYNGGQGRDLSRGV